MLGFAFEPAHAGQARCVSGIGITQADRNAARLIAD